MTRVIVVGDIVTDILAVQSGSIAVGSDTAAQISVTGGGSAANTAAWLASAAIDPVVDPAHIDTFNIVGAVDLVGVIGADAAGRERLAELVAAGVGCAMVRRCAHASTGSVIVLAHAGERSMLCDRGANLLLEPSDVDAALDAAPAAAHLHLSGYTLLDPRSAPAGRHALASAAERGLTTSVDAASAAPLRRLGAGRFLDWVRGVDVLFANLDEAVALVTGAGAGTPDAAAWARDAASGTVVSGAAVSGTVASGAAGAGAGLLARSLAGSARVAIVKLGRDGAVWAGGDGELVAVAAEPARVVDPTGAGDAFAAGVLASWLAGRDAQACLVAGATLGARAVGILGGRPPPPSGTVIPHRDLAP